MHESVPACPVCHGPLIQKSRPRLLAVGVILLAAPALGRLHRWLWIPGLVAGLTGAYLLVWATLGRAQWCRNCKSFPTRR